MPIAVTGYSHIRVTVTDLAKSRAFYESVFGWPVFAELPADADAATRERLAFLYGGVLYQVGGGLFGLRPVASDRFDEDRVGLDHLAFAVADRSGLDDAVDVLDGLGLPHGEIKDVGHGFILEFRDPDNVALELFALKS